MNIKTVKFLETNPFYYDIQLSGTAWCVASTALKNGSVQRSIEMLLISPHQSITTITFTSQHLSVANENTIWRIQFVFLRTQRTMPITENVEVTDNLIVNFGERCKTAQIFSVTIANTGKRRIKVKKISSSLDFVNVLNFNESNSDIKAGSQLSYLFEAAYKQQQSSDLNEGKIRFTFANHSHVTRSIKVVHETCENMPPKIVDLKKDDENPTKVAAAAAVATLTPGIINLQGFIKTDYDNWQKKLDGNWNRKAIEITDDLHIEFDHFHCSQLCEILIRNNAWKKLCLDSIEIDESKITLCESFIDKQMAIEPRDDLKLHFKAVFDSKKFADRTQIGFCFGKIRLRRTIAIQVCTIRYSTQYTTAPSA